MMLNSVIAISVGASFGAVTRWLLGTALNALFPTIPPGTLVANLLGGYLIGLAIAYSANNAALPAEWRLFVITGFLGAMTTFSTFSAEVTTLIQQGRVAWAGAEIAAHVIGSVTMTMLGLATMALLARA
jgi:CrcB protein